MFRVFDRQPGESVSRKRSQPGWPKSQKAFRSVLNRTGWKCWLCGNLLYYLDENGSVRFFDGIFRLSFDHLQPHSEGGTNDAFNLAGTHRICNLRRATRENGLTEAERTLVRYLFRIDPTGKHRVC